MSSLILITCFIVCLICCNCSQIHLCISWLIFFNRERQLLCRISLNFSLSGVITQTDSGFAHLAVKIQHETEFFSVLHIGRHMLLIVIAGNVNIDQLVNILSASFLRCEVSTLLFVIYTQQDIFRLCKYLIIPYTFTHHFPYPSMTLAWIIIVLLVKYWFSKFIISLTLILDL